MPKGYFEPVDEQIWAPHREKPGTFGNRIQVNSGAGVNFDGVQIALLGIHATANQTRRALYNLTWRFGNTGIADLGNFPEKLSEKDRHFALGEVVADLLEKGVIAIILGDSPGWMYGHYRGYRNYPDAVEVVNVTPSVDLEEGSPLRYILTENPSHLFNLDFIGTQAYYINEQTAEVLEKMYFENHRLGEVRNHIEETEPILRSAHMLMFDMNSVRYSDAPGTLLKSPNGLYAEEAARIARYAGISNKLTSAHFYGLDTTLTDSISQTLLAQLIWYFIEGITCRYHDHPEPENQNFIVYRNLLKSTGHEVVFYKSRSSERWWMQVPHPYDNRTYFIGCSYRDYQLVTDDEMPDRWWRAYQRMM